MSASERAHDPSRSTVTNRRYRALLNLDAEQIRAVTHPAKRKLVLAGAGTGKTRVITHRVAYLIETGQARPQEILALTLTNKAATEMIGRLRTLCGAAAEHIKAGTFHSLCHGILRSHPELVGRTAHFSIYDETDGKRVVGRLVTSTERAIVKPAEVLREISTNKSQSIPLERYEAFAVDRKSRIVARVWKEYEAELQRADAFDFDDLLLKTVELLSEHENVRQGYLERWTHVVVDEYQDTTPVQARLLRLLAGRDLMVVGDDKQVIYGFCLAEVRLILDFEREYAGGVVFTLERNYRNSQPILTAANNLISKNTVQRPMRLYAATRKQDGPPVQVHSEGSDAAEADWIASRILRFIEEGTEEREIAVLGRDTKVVQRVERALAAASISYQTVGARGFFRHKEVRTALAHLRLLVSPRNEESFVTALAIRPQVGTETIAKIAVYAARHGLTLLEAASAVDVIEGIRSATTRENVRRFAWDMFEFAARASSCSVAELTRDMIRMPQGVGDSLAKSQDAEQRFARLEALEEVASTYERQTDDPSLAGWLQDTMLAGREDLETDKGRGRASLGTIHGTKGLEWPVVFAAGFEYGIIPSYRAQTQADVEEERRMAYVLFTRTLRTLILCYAQERGRYRSGPSQFIGEALSPSGDIPDSPQVGDPRPPALVVV